MARSQNRGPGSGNDKGLASGEALLSEALGQEKALLCPRLTTPAESEEGGVRALSEMMEPGSMERPRRPGPWAGMFPRTQALCLRGT